MNPEIVCTIAGSDSSGGAGIQSDLKTFHCFGLHGTAVLTAVTAQNNQQLSELAYLAPEFIAAQLAALQTNLAPKAIKLGLLGRQETLRVLENYLAGYSGPVVLDPVLRSASGAHFVSVALKGYLDRLRRFLRFVDVFTPNRFEAEQLLNRPLRDAREIQQGAEALLSLGAKSVLIKGGHFHDPLFSQDYWTDGKTSFWLANERACRLNYRGTGCALSAALTACLALGYEIKDALVVAKMYVNRGIRKAAVLPGKAAWLYHGDWPEEETDLPYLSDDYQAELKPPFPLLEERSLGLYPVVDRFSWVEQLLPCGLKQLQLRVKDKEGSALEAEIRQSVALAKQYQARLFVNDHWELALRYGAYGVHLGQDDFQRTDFEKLRKAGLRLGISTHGYYEMARAHALRPSYLAFGPIYHTTSKAISLPPQGISRLKRWRRTLSYPLVAIGGINSERISEVCSTGVDGVALISAITQAPDPLKATLELLTRVSQHDPHAK